MQVNIHEAKSQLSKLIKAALAGEEVIIANGNRPVVKLVPVPAVGFRLGGLVGKGLSGALALLPKAAILTRARRNTT